MVSANPINNKSPHPPFFCQSCALHCQLRSAAQPLAASQAMHKHTHTHNTHTHKQTYTHKRTHTYMHTCLYTCTASLLPTLAEPPIAASAELRRRVTCCSASCSAAMRTRAGRWGGRRLEEGGEVSAPTLCCSCGSQIRKVWELSV